MYKTTIKKENINYCKIKLKKALTSIINAQSSVFNLSCYETTKKQQDITQEVYSDILRLQTKLRSIELFNDGEKSVKTVEHIY